METLTPPSPTPSNKNSKYFSIIFLLLGILGFFDAGFLTVKHYRGELPVCSIVHGCDRVLNSSYASIGTIPVALLGMINYGIIIIGAILYLDLKNKRLLRLLSIYTLAGLAASIYFVVLQFFILKALCLYCLISAGISTLIFINGMISLKMNK